MASIKARRHTAIRGIVKFYQWYVRHKVADPAKLCVELIESQCREDTLVNLEAQHRALLAAHADYEREDQP